MNARLEYVAGGDRVLLENMILKDLDDYTYRNFESVEEIINSDKYQEKISSCPPGGDVRVFFDCKDIPMRKVEEYTTLGRDAFDEEGSISVVVRNSETFPTIVGVRNKMKGFINSEEAANEFYQRFRDELTPKERFEFLIGMEIEDARLASRGILRMMSEYTSDFEGYFMGRVFIDTLSNFQSVKKNSGAPVKKK